MGGGLSYSDNRTESGIAYDGTLRLASAGGILDIHPFAGVFRISAGLFWDGNKFRLTAKPQAGVININGIPFTAAQVGTMTGEVKSRSAAPFLGLGWGNAVSEGSDWGFNFEVGALYQGTPKVTLTATGAAGNPALASAVAAEQTQLQDALNNFKWYPVVQLGITYRF